MCATPLRARRCCVTVQPLFAELTGGGFAVAHNGNLTNGLTLRYARTGVKGQSYQSTSDTEVIPYLVARSRKKRFADRFIDALLQLEGAYSFVGLTNKSSLARVTRWAFVSLGKAS